MRRMNRQSAHKPTLSWTESFFSPLTVTEYRPDDALGENPFDGEPKRSFFVWPVQQNFRCESEEKFIEY